MIENLFFELIRVAIGTQNALSRLPSSDDWMQLYNMAQKQSLIGVCFAALQKLGADADEGFARIGMNEMLYLTWMGMAAKIQQRNQIVDEQCVALQKRLSADGFRSCILKGQGVGQLYVEHLLGLRQSGDIDVWVPCGMQKALEYVNGRYGRCEFDYINVHVPVFEGTEVELHWRVQALTNVFANRRLQKWLDRPETVEMILGGKVTLANGSEIVTPSAEFDAFYILLHCYHHMFESGLGLRQLMDYYFVLKTLDSSPLKKESFNNTKALIRKFGMMRFAKGVMWLLQEVFGMNQDCMICDSDEHEGRFLLNEVMQNGNFGYHDERIKKVGNGKMSELWRNMQHNWHLVSHYPAEMCWQPIWLVYHYLWKRNLKIK